MDPNENIKRQRELAGQIVKLADTSPAEPNTFAEHDAQQRDLLVATQEKSVELAELVQALDRTEVLDAIRAVVDYCMPSELADAAENGTEGHIVEHLIVLDNYLGAEWDHDVASSQDD